MTNHGKSDSAATFLRFRRSTDRSITSTDTLIATHNVKTLRPRGSFLYGSRQEITHRLLNPPTEPGEYYYGACVEPVQNETDRTNNCSNAQILAVGRPDLKLEQLYVYAFTSIAPSASITVKNIGKGDAPATTVVLTNGSSTIGTFHVDALDGDDGFSYSDYIYADLPVGSVRSGDTVRACITAVAHETATTNNCSRDRALNEAPPTNSASGDQTVN